MTRQRARILRPFRLPLATRTAGATPRAAASRRRSSQKALAVGGLAFVLLSVGLGAGAETVKPEWRDPEYGHRLRQARRWQRDRPERPLVLAFGSSRAQMGVTPADMGFPDEPGSPLVYNFGYRAATPLVSWLLLTRTLDSGVRPRAVLLFISFSETRADMPAEEQFGAWASRLSGADLRRLAPYTTDPAPLRGSVASARRNPVSARWKDVADDLFPPAPGPAVPCDQWSWDNMDAYGFVRFPVACLTEPGRRVLVASAQKQARGGDVPLGAVSDRAVRDLVARCRAEGVAVAVVWTPGSPTYRGAHPPAAWVDGAAYTRTLTAELGVPVFPAPEHLDEADFVDGYHLTPGGAAKYSRWLADEHLKPWLANGR